MKMYIDSSLTNAETKEVYPFLGEDTEWATRNGFVEMDVEQSYDGKWHLKGYAPVKPQEVAEAELQKQMTDAVQYALDAFAKTRGYDGIMSACSYSSSSDAQFKLEADYCIKLRDATWRMGYAVLAEVKAGNRPVPTVEELIAELPVGSAKWPDEQ